MTDRSRQSQEIARQREADDLPAPIGKQLVKPYDALEQIVKRCRHLLLGKHGNTDLQFLEVFRSPYFVDVSLSDWLTHTPPAMVAATFNMDPAEIVKWPKDKPETLPIYQG